MGDLHGGAGFLREIVFWRGEFFKNFIFIWGVKIAFFLYPFEYNGYSVKLVLRR